MNLMQAQAYLNEFSSHVTECLNGAETLLFVSSDKTLLTCLLF
jgi:hypothetical protein